jgi:hypothetical protein
MNDQDRTPGGVAAKGPSSSPVPEIDWVPRRIAFADVAAILGIDAPAAASLLDVATKSGAIRESKEFGEPAPTPDHPILRVVAGPIVTIPALHRGDLAAWTARERARRDEERRLCVAAALACPQPPPAPSLDHGPPLAPGEHPFWVDGDTAIATVKRQWPELSPVEIEGALRSAVYNSTVRYRSLDLPRLPPRDGVAVLADPGPWHRSMRFDEQDVLRWFAQREARLTGRADADHGQPATSAPEGTERHAGGTRDDPGALAALERGAASVPEQPRDGRRAKRGPKPKWDPDYP